MFVGLGGRCRSTPHPMLPEVTPCLGNHSIFPLASFLFPFPSYSYCWLLLLLRMPVVQKPAMVANSIVKA